MTEWSQDESDPAYLKWKEAAELAKSELGDAYTEKDRTESELEAALVNAQRALNSLSLDGARQARTALGGYIRARLSLSASEQRISAASGNLLRIMNSLPEGDAPTTE